MTLQQLDKLTPAQRAANWRRFEALMALDQRVRDNPAFLSLPPRVRQESDQPRS